MMSLPQASTTERPSFATTDPATGTAGPVYAGLSLKDAHRVVAAAAQAQHAWQRQSFTERGAVLQRAASRLRDRRDELAALMTSEMGKTLTDGRGEIEKCALQCEHYALNAAGYLARQTVQIEKASAFVTFQPLGVVLAVMPWNFPFWQVFRFAAPTLMAGNGAVLKHASNVPGCALAIESVFVEAGLPPGLFGCALIRSGEVAALIQDRNIAAVTLTGSVAAGRSVARTAAEVLKKCVLELGGSDPYVVLEDADIQDAASVCARARMVNGGQSCVAGKRFVVIESVRAAFEQALVARMQAFTMGDPRDARSKLGPLVSVMARDEIHEQVRASITGGARLLLGGEVPVRAGAWYPPTVLADVRPGQPAYDAEIFGPVAAIISARDEADAIRIANDSEFGLGAAVLTADAARGGRIAAEELQAGMTFVNDNVRSDPRLPFGGIKQSGYGRECGAFGIYEFVNIKTVQMRAATKA